MTEFEIIYQSFMGFMLQSRKYSDAGNEVIEKYGGVFIGANDSEDIIKGIWKNFGFCSYKNGLFTLINPEEFNELARAFPDVSDDAEVFARTATGCLFLWEEYSFGKSITFLNIHTAEKKIVSTSFNVLFEWDLPVSSFWLEDCNGETEFAVMEKFKTVPHDKCAGYRLGLPLGGKANIGNMELFDFKAHLELLAQLHS